MRAAGATVDYERHVPELYEWDERSQRCKEAILGVVCTGPGSLALQSVDVSISCPYADRATASATKPGHVVDWRRSAKRRGMEILSCR